MHSVNLPEPGNVFIEDLFVEFPGGLSAIRNQRFSDGHFRLERDSGTKRWGNSYESSTSASAIYHSLRFCNHTGFAQDPTRRAVQGFGSQK